MKVINKSVFWISLAFVVLLAIAFSIPGVIPCNTLVKGLVFDIIGVLITFFRGLPSSGYEDGVGIGLEDGTEITDDDGVKMTVKEFRELQILRKRWHMYCSWLGLACLCIGFVVQAIASL